MVWKLQHEIQATEHESGHTRFYFMVNSTDFSAVCGVFSSENSFLVEKVVFIAIYSMLSSIYELATCKYINGSVKSLNIFINFKVF